MKIKVRTKRIIAGMLALFMLFGSIPYISTGGDRKCKGGFSWKKR